MWRDFYSRFLGHFSGRKALFQATEQNRLERFFTFRNFEASAGRCGRELAEAGLSQVEVESFPADGTTCWYGWSSMKAWDVEAARLWMIASPELDVEAVLALVDRIVESGYLKVKEERAKPSGS